MKNFFRRWLISNAAVIECAADPSDQQLLIIEVVITLAAFSKFRSYFPQVKSLSAWIGLIKLALGTWLESHPVLVIYFWTSIEV